MTQTDFWKTHPCKFSFCKVGCVFPMVVVSILLQIEFGSNDHREDAPHFIISCHDQNRILENSSILGKSSISDVFSRNRSDSWPRNLPIGLKTFANGFWKVRYFDTLSFVISKSYHYRSGLSYNRWNPNNFTKLTEFISQICFIEGFLTETSENNRSRLSRILKWNVKWVASSLYACLPWLFQL